MVAVLCNLPLAIQLAENPTPGSGLQPWWLVTGCVLLMVSVLAANASAALLLYSPSRLKKLLGPERGSATLALLRRGDLELRVMARLIMVVTAACGLWLINANVHGSLGQLTFIGICLAAVVLVAVLPAAMAQRAAERVVVTVLPVLSPLRILLLYPVIRPMIWCCRPVMKALKIPDCPPMEPVEIADEILDAVSDPDGSDALAEEEKTWIGNIVALKQRYVAEVMMPRTDIHALEASLPLSEAIELAVAKGHSRFPVYQETIDNVVGVFYAKDVLGRLANSQDTCEVCIGEITREPLFAPESMLVGDLLREFKSSKVQIAIVLDEYGGTAGLITIEDILEEIVGEIADEFDPEEEVLVHRVRGNHVLEVSGKARIEDVNATLGALRIPDGEDYDTIGGFVFSHLGQIPSAGETFQIHGLEYRILQVDKRRVHKVRLTLLQPHPSEQ